MWADARDFIVELWNETQFRTCFIIAVFLALAFVAEYVFRRVFAALAQRTRTDADDKIVAALRRPIFWSVIFIGLSWAVSLNHLSARPVIFGVIKSLAILLWMVASIRVAEILLQSIARRARDQSLIQKGTLPVFDILMKVVIISGAFYAIFLAWDINVTAWLASAGIMGIAVGFAAQDTLANVISGIVILADGPYKVGDFIMLEEGQRLRGRVTRVGLRSTRIVTLDNVEITIPNAEIGKSKIINEVGGPSIRQRIRATVSVAYGSDIDQVADVLRTCPEGVKSVLSRPEPEVRFVSFGASGLDFELLVWIDEPAGRDVILSELNIRIYKQLNAAHIEIPYNKHDIYIKQMPHAPGE